MKEITLSGTFYEMGQQYGSSVKRKIKNFIFLTRLMAVASEGEGRDFFRPKVHHMLGGLFQMSRYKKKYRRVAEEFEKNIARYYPEILELIQGMADAAGVDHRDIIFMNCLVEYSLKCSAFGAAGTSTREGKPLIAMNADEAKSTRKYYMTIHFKPKDGYDFTAVYMAGTIFPIFGMNEKGLSVASLLLFLNNEEFEKIRLPFFLKFSIIHSCRSVDEARDVLDRIPASGSGTALYVADGEKLLVQEENSFIKTNKVYENGVHHTANYPLFQELEPFVKIDELDDIIYFFAKNRHRRIGEFLKAHDGSLDEEIFHSILSDHGSTNDDSLNKSVCVHPENSNGIQTCASIVLSPRDREMTIYEGNPCKNVAKKYSFTSSASTSEK